MKTSWILITSLIAAFQFSSSRLNNNTNIAFETAVIVEENEPTTLVFTLPADDTPTVEPKKNKTLSSVSKANKQNMKRGSIHRELMQKATTEKDVILFSFDDSEIMDHYSFNTILQFADKLLFDKSLSVSISGYADITGNDAYNDLLSLKRVQNVKAYLMEIGVNETQIITSFNGTDYPVADNDTEAGRAENRRVEFALFSH